MFANLDVNGLRTRIGDIVQKLKTEVSLKLTS